MSSAPHRVVVLLTLLLTGMLMCRAPLSANEASWLPVSQVMSELSQNPDFVEALYTRLGRNPKAGGILGPDEIKRLRELILGKNFEALDRFPGMTVTGMGRAVRLAAAAMDKSTDTAIPQPDAVEGTDRAPIEEELGIPAAGRSPAPDAYLRSLGFGLEVGDRIDPELAGRYADSLRLAEVLNRLSLDSRDDASGYHVVIGGQPVDTPSALMNALTEAGHDLEVRDSRYFANFGDLIYQGRDVLTPFWIDTGITVPGTDRLLLVPVSHSQHEFIVRGPVVNAALSFYFGIDGEAVFRPSVTRDQAWVMGNVAHRYQGAEALEVTRLASGIVRAYSMIKQHHPELPFGGYYALGVCNDVNAMIELKMQGETSLFPLTLDPQFFAGDGEVERLARRLPLDNGRDAKPDPRRILGSIPVAELSMLPLPLLRQDLEEVRAAWGNGSLAFSSSRGALIWVLTAIACLLAFLLLVRSRQASGK
ncbi:hypothetical protein SAE02_42360 [Skermanella aerolata]|uniref:Uncharacterized protein n=1 Tax=Skermanella aerolata TaxID=393310 RepID=A0A512DUE3_9PROT|nr:hypothetical protein [Skermanella aerolata]KJB92957.1 hypothetical protein N826_19255 [Skermanella aerolata KACC 11604]GEO40088.1 hypothetical protein SAE02_42360 [Skermanella aerolata]